MELPPVAVLSQDGAILYIHVVPVPALFDTMVQSWDMTFKDKVTSDYVVGQVWGAKDADRFLLDQTRARLDLPGTREAVRSLSARWPKATAKLVEDKANGPAVIQELRHQLEGLIEVTPEGGKIARARCVGHRRSRKRVSATSSNSTLGGGVDGGSCGLPQWSS